MHIGKHFGKCCSCHLVSICAVRDFQSKKSLNYSAEIVIGLGVSQVRRGREVVESTSITVEVLMRRLGACVLALTIAGCGGELDDVRSAVAYKLKDPGSAQFRNEREVSGGKFCGEVNGKNAFGAYSGFHPFLAVQGEHGFEVTIDATLADRFASAACGYAMASTDAPSAGKPMEVQGAGWAVQVASLSNSQKADALVKDLSEAGFLAYSKNTAGTSRVFVGPISSRAEADQEIDRLFREKSMKGFLVVLKGEGAK